MKSPIPLIVLMFLVLFTPAYAAQSTITEADGNACMGMTSQEADRAGGPCRRQEKGRRVRVDLHQSETHVKNFELEKDLLSAYANAEVKIIRELDKSWYKDPSSGDCCKIKIKAEIIPDVKAMETLSRDTRFSDDPSAP